jgi:aryl-alcohol dehydrogenase-like predicted oxidoreductase
MMNTGTTTAANGPDRRDDTDPATRRGDRATLARATVEGTARFAARFAPTRTGDFYRNAAGDLFASSIGIGTYLGDSDDAEDRRYERAVVAAVDAGINVVDTAINYRCQRSERAVGRALASIERAGKSRRDELVICTKGGYVPLDGAVPATREEYQALLEREYFARGTMRPEDVVGGGHCMSPTFLADQVARSRDNLGVATIDVYYLHNPEQQLPTLGREAFRRRVLRAFETFEARVEAGEIGVYGCATWNGFRVGPDARDHLSLEEIVGVAREVAGESHHFAVVQLPVNLAMSEALRAQTQRLGGREVTLVEAALELGVTVVASASLMQAALARPLPPVVRDALPRYDTDAQRALAFVRSAPGVTTALIGMRSEAHVRENVAIAAVREGGGKR